MYSTKYSEPSLGGAHQAPKSQLCNLIEKVAPIARPQKTGLSCPVADRATTKQVFLSQMPQTAWAIGAAERRCDGGRVTELVKAKDWLAMHGESRGPEVNPLEPSIKGDMPPALPTYLSRDHLHDRNRQNALFDPAQPGLETYVRVTAVARHPRRRRG